MNSQTEVFYIEDKATQMASDLLRRSRQKYLENNVTEMDISLIKRTLKKYDEKKKYCCASCRYPFDKKEMFTCQRIVGNKRKTRIVYCKTCKERIADYNSNLVFHNLSDYFEKLRRRLCQYRNQQIMKEKKIL